MFDRGPATSGGSRRLQGAAFRGMVELWSFGWESRCVHSLDNVFAIHPSDHVADETKAICEAVFSLLISAPAQAEMASQLKRISIRMEGRRGIDPEIARTWKNAYESSVRRGYPAATDSDPICDRLGCESTAPAEMICSRCMCTCYCSKVCQKSYVPTFALFSIHRLRVLSKQRLEIAQTILQEDDYEFKLNRIR